MFKLIKPAFKKYFITGLLVAMPLYLTIYIFSIIVSYMDNLLTDLPAFLRPDTYLKFHIPGLGVIFTVVVILFVGILATNLLGKKLVAIGNNMIDKIPLFRSIYKPLKQFTETFLITGQSEFKKVVLVEFPNKGMYSVGFLTGFAIKEIQCKTKDKVLNVFIPTSPNPTTGFYLLIPEKDIMLVDISVEDAFKLIVTSGMITPEKKIENVLLY